MLAAVAFCELFHSMLANVAFCELTALCWLTWHYVSYFSVCRLLWHSVSYSTPCWLTLHAVSSQPFVGGRSILLCHCVLTDVSFCELFSYTCHSMTIRTGQLIAEHMESLVQLRPGM